MPVKQSDSTKQHKPARAQKVPEAAKKQEGAGRGGVEDKKLGKRLEAAEKKEGLDLLDQLIEGLESGKLHIGDIYKLVEEENREKEALLGKGLSKKQVNDIVDRQRAEILEGLGVEKTDDPLAYAMSVLRVGKELKEKTKKRVDYLLKTPGALDDYVAKYMKHQHQRDQAAERYSTWVVEGRIAKEQTKRDEGAETEEQEKAREVQDDLMREEPSIEGKIEEQTRQQLLHFLRGLGEGSAVGGVLTPPGLTRRQVMEAIRERLYRDHEGEIKFRREGEGSLRKAA